MKRALIVSLLVLLVLAGCSGIIANAKYSTLIDRTVALSDEATTRAVVGSLSTTQMVQVLQADNASWHAIQAAKNGAK